MKHALCVPYWPWVLVCSRFASAHVSKTLQCWQHKAVLQTRLYALNFEMGLCCNCHAGMRFAGADTTVKLQQDKTYVISITTTPAVAVT